MTVGRVAVEEEPAGISRPRPAGFQGGDWRWPRPHDLQEKYPDVLFTGIKTGEDLADAYAQADVFVFPSKTDTFGNTILEALASGVPVAAFPVTGPIDILGGNPAAGALDNNLRNACLAALHCSPQAALALSKSYSWEKASKQFLDNVIHAAGKSLPLLVPFAACLKARHPAFFARGQWTKHDGNVTRRSGRDCRYL